MALTYEEMLARINIDESTARRHNKRKTAPRQETLTKVLQASNDLNEMLIFPYQTAQAKQCKKAQMALAQDEPADIVHRLIADALAMTGISEKDYIGKLLLAQEPELLHTLAKLYAREGELTKATAMLENVLASLQKLSSNEKYREIKAAPILLSLASYRLQAKDFVGALEACDAGFDISAKREQGRSCPDFLFIKALALAALNGLGDLSDKALCQLLLTKAYAGYVALNNAHAAHHVLSTAKTKLGIDLQTYGMETLLYELKPKYSNIWDLDDYEKFASLGHVLAYFHKRSGLTSKEVYTGICGKETFSKLKNDKIKTPNIFVVEALMQRMGRDINLYYSLLVPYKDFDLVQQRDRVLTLQRAAKYSNAAAALEVFEQIESSKRDESQVLMQFIRATKATLYGATCDRGVEYLKKLQKALLLTIPHFNERDIARYPLTLREAVLIQQVAIYYEMADDAPRAICIYRDLLHNIETRWVDRTLQTSMYTTVSFNYSSCLGRAGRRREALAVAEKALEYGVTCGDLDGILGLYYNQGYDFLLSNQKNESLPLLMLSYYASLIFEDYGAADDVQVTKKTIEENFCVFL